MIKFLAWFCFPILLSLKVTWHLFSIPSNLTLELSCTSPHYFLFTEAWRGAMKWKHWSLSTGDWLHVWTPVWTPKNLSFYKSNTAYLSLSTAALHCFSISPFPIHDWFLECLSNLNLWSTNSWCEVNTPDLSNHVWVEQGEMKNKTTRIGNHCFRDTSRCYTSSLNTKASPWPF